MKSRLSRIFYIGIPVAALTVLAIVNRDLILPPQTLLEEVPQVVRELQPEIESARIKYVKKGDEYIWGSNDCSIFVMDYIIACGKKVKSRPTTETLMNPIATQAMGFIPTKTNPKIGDILVYRYQNRDNQWRGHTGVVVWYKGALWVAHNTATRDGLVIQRLDKFKETADRLTKGRDTAFKVLRRTDHDVWYANFKKRRSQAS